MTNERINKIRAAIGEIIAAQCRKNSSFYYMEELQQLENQLKRELAKAA